MSGPNDLRRARGFTLIEMIVFVVIVAVGLAGILAVMNNAVRASADPVVRKQAMAMAEAVLDEVLSRDPLATLPETDLANCSHRLQYVGVQDYACFDGAPATAVIAGNATLGAAPDPGLAGLAATVAVTPVTVSGVALLRVTVTVTGAEAPITITGYRVSAADF